MSVVVDLSWTRIACLLCRQIYLHLYIAASTSYLNRELSLLMLTHQSFPYTTEARFTESLKTLYTLVWDSNGTSTPIGFIVSPVLSELLKIPRNIRGDLDVDHSSHTISAFQLATEKERSRVVASVVSYWREHKTFQILAGWRDELYPVYGPGNELLYSVERSASTLLVSFQPRTVSKTLSNSNPQTRVS